MKTPQQHFEEFSKIFSDLSDNEIIERFNLEIGNKGWVSARGAYLVALQQEFRRRDWDYSDIGDEKSLSLKNMVKLCDKKLIII